MAKDLNFDKIMKELQNIHEEFPDMRFGSVLQIALDEDRRQANTNLHDISSKKVLTALQNLRTNTKKRREKNERKAKD